MLPAMSTTTLSKTAPSLRLFGKSGVRVGRPASSPFYSRPFVLREKDCQPLFVPNAEARSPNDSPTSENVIDYVLGQGTYQLVAVICTVLSVSIMAATPQVFEKFLGISLTPVTNLIYRNAASLLFVPLAMSYRLQAAIAAKNVDSSTYKRLSLTMALALATVFGIKFYRISQGYAMPSFGVWLSSIFQLLPAVGFFKLYGVSTLPDVIPGVISGVVSLFQLDNINSAIYALLSAATMVYAVVAVASPSTLASVMLTVKVDTFAQFLLQIVGSLTFLVSIACFSLKDGADRGRLAYSTFKYLNIGLFVASIAVIGNTVYVAKFVKAATTTATTTTVKAAQAVASSAAAAEATTCILTNFAWATLIGVSGTMALVSGYNALMAKKD